MSPLFINPAVQVSLDAARASLPQGLLLTGPTGIGLMAAVKYIAENYQLAGTIVPGLLTKTSTVPQIGVDTIRQLYELTRGKTNTPQVVIIDDADMMTEPAQNSFLKLLEEPNSSTHFILASHHPELLLPTVRSRLQTIYLPPLLPEQTETFMAAFPKLDAAQRQQLHFIADGLPAELTRLLEDEVYFQETAARLSLARTLVEASPYDRLAQLQRVRLNRQEALRLLEAVLTLVDYRPTPATVKLADRLLTGYERIQRGGNVTLQLAAAMV